MGKFCGKCGAPVDESTGQCKKCDAPNLCRDATLKKVVEKNDTSKVDNEVSINNVRNKEQQKKEKKDAWNAAKKLYKTDVSTRRGARKTAKKEKRSKRTTKQKMISAIVKIVIIILLLVSVAIGVYFALRNMGLFSAENSADTTTTTSISVTTTAPSDDNQGSGPSDVDGPPDWEMPDGYEPPITDSDDYFSQNSEVVQEIAADTAGRTETEAYQNLEERGFAGQPINVEYDMNGEYSSATEISPTGTLKHPIYYTMFIAENGDVWMIFEINGAVFASPISYNYGNSYSVEVMISETETITSYDSTVNKFYVTKPLESVLNVKVVERIDAETLNRISTEGVDSL